MSTIQTANLNFESTANNQLVYDVPAGLRFGRHCQCGTLTAI